ncbi:hypothetical protein MXB_5497 [Myxobolus squamalis]|nr:hypothetical protein MXB_5497 [Myxobolus squamalis]
MYDVHLDHWLPCKDIELTGKQTYRKPIAGTGKLSSTNIYSVDQICFQSMDLRLTPNNIYFNICKNATTIFDTAAFTILTN